jgi:hypothetical protein
MKREIFVSASALEGAYFGGKRPLLPDEAAAVERVTQAVTA